jgi:hypothetical protein
LEHDARPPRRSWTDHLGELAAREPAAERRVQGRDARRRTGRFVAGIERRQRSGEGAVEAAGPQQGFEIDAGERHDVVLFVIADFRFIFA